MKKIKFLSLIIIFFLVITGTVVFADNTFEVELQPSATELQRGEQFNVKLLIHQNTDEKGIQGFEAKLEYDTDVLELQKNNNNLDAYTENGTYDVTVNEQKIIIAENSLNNIQNNVVIVTIPFKVKDDANYEETSILLSEISGSHIDLETGDSTNYTGTSEEIKLNIVEQKQEEVVKLNEIKVTNNPTKINYNEGEKFNPEGMIVEAIYSDNSSSVITNYTYSPKDELKESDNKIYISYKEGNETKETTLDIKVNKNAPIINKDSDENEKQQKQEDKNKIENQNDTTVEINNSKTEETKLEKSNEADGKLPQTGMIGSAIPVVLVIGLIVMAVVFFKKYNKLNF